MEFALYACATALVPLTPFALERPAVVAASVVGVSVGLVARPLRHRLSRRPRR